MAPEGSPAAPEAPEKETNATWYIAELEAEIDRLRGDVRRLKANQSFGYVRGRGLVAIPAGKIDMSKPRVEAIDIPPVAAQLKDD